MYLYTGTDVRLGVRRIRSGSNIVGAPLRFVSSRLPYTKTLAAFIKCRKIAFKKNKTKQLNKRTPLCTTGGSFLHAGSREDRVFSLSATTGNPDIPPHIHIKEIIKLEFEANSCFFFLRYLLVVFSVAVKY